MLALIGVLPILTVLGVGAGGLFGLQLAGPDEPTTRRARPEAQRRSA